MEVDGIIEVGLVKIWYNNRPKKTKIHLLFQSNWNEIADSFDEMNLREDLLRGIYAYGFEKPSAIQQRAIIPCIRGKPPRFFLLDIFLFNLHY